MARRGNRRHSPRKQSRKSDNCRDAKLVWSKKVRTGTGSVEIAVFSKSIDNGDASFTAFNAVLRKVYEEGDELKVVHSFRSEDLLPLGAVLTQAWTWVSNQET